MKVIARSHGRYSASTYYRQDVPFRAAEKLGLVDFDGWAAWPNITDKESWVNTIPHAMSQDVIQIYSSINGGQFAIQKMNQGLRKKNEKTPIMVYDCDDNTHHIHPLNPVFRALGTRNLLGKKLKKGDKVLIPLPDGELITLLEDGKDDFDIERNHDLIKKLELTIKGCDGFTASTPRLADYFKYELKLKNVHVFPNSIIESDWPKVETVKHKGTVRVLWQGANAHYPDWYEIKEGVEECVKKFPEVVWVIWGTKYDWIHDVIPEDRLEFHDWVPYEAYRYKLATLDFDFALAPLVPNTFNACKSAIKWYEAGMMGKPTLARRTPPYSDEMVDKETGMLFSGNEEFVEKFEALVRDGELRNRLAENTRDWLQENRSVEKTVPPLIEWYQHVRKDAHGSRKKRYTKRKRQKSVSGLQRAVDAK